ncbi:hypothetical protein [Candidatus Viadribacter manganicus]|uniref:hypothetical protein n=1 Tax=Candidatus Viadribacter manganicus TaxID=1759059 RepID=UPI0012E9CDF4|nr:hypothetical protein [Candidatus Viadribacter manganicus]
MMKLAASAIATAFSLVMLGGSAVATMRSEEAQPQITRIEQTAPHERMRFAPMRHSI